MILVRCVQDPCIEVCMPQCVCDEGLVRDTDGSCKPLKTCKLKGNFLSQSSSFEKIKWLILSYE